MKSAYDSRRLGYQHVKADPDRSVNPKSMDEDQ